MTGLITFDSDYDFNHCMHNFFEGILPKKSVYSNFQKCRKKIIEIDEQIIELLAERMQLAEIIGKIKNDKDILIKQTDYWKRTSVQRFELAMKLGLDQKLVESIFEEIHLKSIDKQSNL